MSEHEHHVEVRVVTTAGVFPTAGFEREPANQPVARILERARHALHITDTSNWIAVAGGHRIDPNLSYAASHLGPRVEIDWGPDHGAGGRA
jgi:hypothetical protein